MGHEASFVPLLVLLAFLATLVAARIRELTRLCE